MDQTNPEGNPSNGDNLNGEFAKRLADAFEQVQQQISQQIDNQIREIRNSGLTEQEQNDRLKDLGDQIRQRALENMRQHEEKSKQSVPEGETGEKIKQEKKQAELEMKKSLSEITQAAKKGIDVAKSDRAQAVLKSLADKPLSDSGATDIVNNLGEYLLGNKEILIPSSNQGKSDFEKALSIVEANNPADAQNVIDSLAENAAQFGKDAKEVRERFGQTIIDSQRQYEEAMSDQEKRYMNELFPHFSEEQKDFLYHLDDVDYFFEKTKRMVSKIKNNAVEVDKLKHEISEIYRRHLNEDLSQNQDKLDQLVDKNISIKVSEEITTELIGAYIQLYERLTVEGAHKAFEEGEQEDFMHGILVMRNKIISNIQKLHTDLAKIEKENPDDPRFMKFYKTGEEAYVTQEIDIKGTLRPVPRLRPIPDLKEVSASEFVINLWSELNHWRERSAYLHNGKMTFGHPAHGGDSFYKGLGNYAESVKGVDLDSFMLLPDAPIILEAFQLYEKFIAEDYAKNDWRLRANQFSNKLSETNTQIEIEIKDYLKRKYEGNISEMQLMNAVNSAVGLARAVFLSEPEKNAYADPVSPSGGGYFASYGTNDASSLNAFNPLHTILRWQGEQHFNQILFMPLTGDKGPRFWDHNEMFKNIKAFQKSFSDLEHGTEGTNKNLMIDKLLGIAKTGGIFKRAGWRDFYLFESHYKIDGNKLDLLESFKAMDVIGYEAIKYFLENLDSSFYNYYETGFGKAKDGTPKANQREELFKYIFDRYFKPFTSKDYDQYKSELRNEAIEALKGKKNITNMEEAIRSEMSKIFFDRTIAYEVASRFPSKFLTVDKDRFHENGEGSRWRQIFESFREDLKKQNPDFDETLLRDRFDSMMKDLGFVEMLLRSENSHLVSEAINITGSVKDRSLGGYDDLISTLNEGKIRELLKNKGFSDERLNNVIKLYERINKKFLSNDKFMNKEAYKVISNYGFSFGLEDTDMRLIAFRGTGPRMIARSIGDVALMEEKVINGIMKLPGLFHEMSIDGKQDFSKVIEYLRQAQDAFRGVHGVGEDFEFIYKVAGMTINYFKKDSKAKPLFGIFRFNKINSIAAEYAGRSTGVWEWDSRDIDRFIVALESYNLLPKNPYNKSVGATKEPVYVNAFGKSIKIGVKRAVDWQWNSQRLRKEFGGDNISKVWDIINSLGIIAAAYVLWEYIKKAFEEAEGKKK